MADRNHTTCADPVGWRVRAVCRTLPADWWETGDDGNRLAITLCRLACPVVVECAAGDPTPHGVIRGGVVWRDSGEPAPLCDCGRPIARTRASSASCVVCDPPTVPLPKPLLVGRARPGEVDRHADTIADLVGRGWSHRAIGVRLGCKPSAVRSVARRRGLRPRVAA